MVVTFLGTGTSQGVPVITCTCAVCTSLDYRNKRLRASVHVQADGLSLVIDTGPDFRQQMLQNNVITLNAVLLTHEHKDHTAGLDDVRAYNFAQQSDMPLYALSRVQEQVRQEFAYAFATKKYPGIPQIQQIDIDNRPFEIEGVLIEPLAVKHHMLDILGFKIGNFAYITDANFLSSETIEKISGVKVLVLNALQQSSHVSHFTLAEAIAQVAVIQPEMAYFTHISHKLGSHSEVENELPSQIKLAYDGLKINIDSY
jgi:phosphoribosyl 1,2-cyclic phosphate phosphodiesterase